MISVPVKMYLLKLASTQLNISNFPDTLVASNTLVTFQDDY